MAASPKPFLTGIGPFDQKIAPFVCGGQAWMFFGTYRRFNSDLVCQAAGHTVASGRRVLFISTYMNRADILRHIYSSVSGAPLGQLRAITASNADQPLGVAFRRWSERMLAGFLCPVECSKGINGGMDYQSIFMRAVADSNWLPDLTVVDCLNDLTDMAGPFNDHIERCKAVEAIADEIVRMASQHDHTAIVTAKANPKCGNKRELFMHGTSDSKSLHELMAGVVGVTSLIQPTGGGELYKKDQYLVVCKSPEHYNCSVMVKHCPETGSFSSEFDVGSGSAS